MFKMPRWVRNIFADPKKIIVDYLHDHPDSSGAQISMGTGLGSGTLYPALCSLEITGALKREFKLADGFNMHRHLYSLKEPTT